MAIHGGRRLAALLLTVCVLLTMLSGCGGRTDPETLDAAIANRDQVVADLRNGLKKHSPRITVTFSYGWLELDDVQALASLWLEEALAETGDPEEGDYLRYQYDRCDVTCSRDGDWDGCTYAMIFYPTYYIRPSQEAQVGVRLEEVWRELDIPEDATAYEKVRAVYDFVCGHVVYDISAARRHGSTNVVRHTAYSALIRGTATCQGYCTLLYRMLMSLGVETRIVTGYAPEAEGPHAWNLVKLDGAWYGLDATWDAGKEETAYFLRGAEVFGARVPGGTAADSTFWEEHPLAAEDYVPAL